jgi:23S rRNA (uracil1939-C5)-methyltransferase
MYKKAIQLLDIKSDTTVVDLYSGIGITSIMFSKLANQVLSIEEVADAVDNAKYMAKLNGVKNIVHLCGKCEAQISKIKTDGDVVAFVDPARAGLDIKVIEAIKQMNPRKVVYMSCNPESCEKDIKQILSGNKYTITDIIPYNMFPYTKHIEMLICLQSRK